jgi:O-antigen/teichoic acid export membrane protein
MEVRDWIVIALMASIQLAATVFVFVHPDSMNFATWATVVGGLVTAYHWIVIRDSKQADAA